MKALEDVGGYRCLQILHYLETEGPLTTSEIAERIDRTPNAVRQALVSLRDRGEVESCPNIWGETPREKVHQIKGDFE